MTTPLSPSAHWNYYLALEQDLEKLSRYIEFHEDNYCVYSIEITRLLLATAAEVDVVLKNICEFLDASAKRYGIDDYRKLLLKHDLYMVGSGVVCRRYDLNFKPFKSWQNPKPTNPEWWLAYNKTKHRRHEHYEEANLGNLLHASAALLVTNLFYKLHFVESNYGNVLNGIGWVIQNTHPQSQLFRLSDSILYMHE